MNSGILFSGWRSVAVVALGLLAGSTGWAQGQNAGARVGQGGGVNTGAAGTGGGYGSSQASRQYTNSTMVGDAMISSDADTRRIIVVTDEVTNENIRQVIENLDKPKPQVLINVVFLQVSHDKDLDLGAEASYKGPIAIKTNPEGTATTRFGVDAQYKDATQYGAFYQLTGRDVTATIHALSTVNKTEILSRPTILTRSNQMATIMVGQSVPMITNSRVSDTTNTTINTVEYRDVGIILRVTPFITAEGTVEMILSPEISSLGAKTVPISNNVSSPVIDKRAADTVIVTKSDDTVVIGGLISNQSTDTDDKVPLLGDIPLLGYAFRHKSKSTTKTELLIFLTPHVVSSPEELSRISNGERRNMDLAPQAIEKADIGKFIPAPAKS